MSQCIECEGPVSVPEDVFVGEIVHCGDCGVELEVTEVQPMALALAPEVQEDWGE